MKITHFYNYGVLYNKFYDGKSDIWKMPISDTLFYFNMSHNIIKKFQERPSRNQ